MSGALAFFLACAGFFLLALSMERHYRQVRRQAGVPPAAGAWRAAGALCLAASLAACIADTGWQVGIVLWCGWLSAAAILVVLLLAFVPDKLWPLRKGP